MFWRQVSWRWWGMQLALVGVMLATLGLGAWLVHMRREEGRVALGTPQTAAAMSVPSPVGWISRQLPDGILFEEQSSPSAEPGRRIEVHHLRGIGFISPLELLSEYGSLDLRELDSSRSAVERDSSGIRPLTLARWPGMMFSQTAYRVYGNRPAQARKNALACVVLPWGDALVVRLDGVGVLAPGDEDLIRRLGEGIRVEQAPAPRAAGTLDLADGITMPLPPGMQTTDEQDKFRTDRLLFQTPGKPWLAVDLVACYFPDSYGATELEAMLRLRGPRFEPGEVRRIEPGLWVCPRDGDSLFPAVAYLLQNKDGRAVLAEFRWNRLEPGLDPPTIEKIWRQMASTIAFSGQSDYDTLVERGKAVVASHPPLRELIGRQDTNQTWQWYEESAAQDWLTQISYRIEESALIAEVQTRQSPWGAELGKWALAAGWKAYEHDVTRLRPPRLVRTQKTVMRNGKVAMALSDGRSTIKSPPVTRPLFMPGGVLPLVMGRFNLEPLALQTESIPAPGEAAASMPLLLILEPSYDVPREGGAEQTAMRCWSVRINGTGQRSRWYFDETGTLQVISFPGGLHLQREEPQ